MTWFHGNISFSCFARRHSIPFERLTPAPFSQLIYCLADAPALSGSPPVAPTCGSVLRDAPSIIPHMGGESFRQSRLNYIIVRAPPTPPTWVPPKCSKKHHPPTHTSAPRWSAHPRTLVPGWDIGAGGGGLPRWEHPSVAAEWKVRRECTARGSEPRLENLPLSAEAISHPGGWGAQRKPACYSVQVEYLGL